MCAQRPLARSVTKFPTTTITVEAEQKNAEEKLVCATGSYVARNCFCWPDRSESDFLSVSTAPSSRSYLIIWSSFLGGGVTALLAIFVLLFFSGRVSPATTTKTCEGEPKNKKNFVPSRIFTIFKFNYALSNLFRLNTLVPLLLLLF